MDPTIAERSIYKNVTGLSDFELLAEMVACDEALCTYELGSINHSTFVGYREHLLIERNLRVARGVPS